MVIETQVGEQEADLAMLFEAIYRVTTRGGDIMKTELYFEGEVTVRIDSWGNFWARFIHPVSKTQLETNGNTFSDAVARLAREMESEGCVPCYPRR